MFARPSCKNRSVPIDITGASIAQGTVATGHGTVVPRTHPFMPDRLGVLSPTGIRIVLQMARGTWLGVDISMQ